MFTRISLIALNFILVRNSFDATFSVSVFIRLDPRQLIYLFTPPE